jgi:hypothetical protein
MFKGYKTFNKGISAIKVMLPIMVAIALSCVFLTVFLAGCGGGGGNVSTGGAPNPPGPGNSITPVWTFDKIPDLKFAKISRNGKWAIVASAYHIAFLDIINKTELSEIHTSETQNDFVCNVSISDLGYAVVSTAHSIKVLSAANGLIADFSEIQVGKKTLTMDGGPVEICPSGTSYYAYGHLKFNVPNSLLWYIDLYLYDNNGNIIGYNPHYESSNLLSVSGNGEYIASASSIWNSPVLLNGNGVMLWKSTYENDAVESIAISYNGNVIALGTLSEITIYTKDNPTPIIKWPHNSYGAVVAVSNNGNVVAGGLVSGKLVIFENLSPNPKVFDKPDGQVVDIAISSDGNIIVLATDFGGLEIYDKSGDLKYQHDTEYSGVVGSVSISSDGKIVGCVFMGKFNLYKIP